MRITDKNLGNTYSFVVEELATGVKLVTAYESGEVLFIAMKYDCKSEWGTVDQEKSDFLRGLNDKLTEFKMKTDNPAC